MVHFFKKKTNEEYNSLLKNGTWSLKKIQKGKRPCGSSWVFKIKGKVNGEMDKYNAWLVSKVFAQIGSVGFFLKRHFICYVHIYQNSINFWSNLQLGNSSNGCERCFFEWQIDWRCLHGTIRQK